MIRNTALYRAAWHSSAANYDNTAHLITDGHTGFLADNIPDAWISAGNGGEWVYIDLGAATTLERAVIHWGAEYAKTYEVQLSDDKSAWNTVATASGAADSAVETAINGKTARYVRILCRECSGDKYVINNAEVYGENNLIRENAPLPAFDNLNAVQSLDGGNWKICRAAQVDADGATLSAAYDDSAWLPATLPGTALSSYLDNGAVPDPNYDDWQFQVSDAYFTADFWYRTSVFVPEDWKWWLLHLNFDAINWKADVWFNGRLLPNADSTREHSIEGAFIRGKFNVTEYVNYGGENYIAVKIHKNDTPGEVTTQGLAEGPGPNGGLLGADNPTMHAAVGWDWLPTIRGRDIGIYGSVWLACRGTIDLLDPFIEPDLAINESSVTVAAEDYAKHAGVNVTSGADAVLRADDAQWVAADMDGDSFVVNLGADVNVGCVTLVWGTESGGAAADMESRHPASFRLERSIDGRTWVNIDAHDGGEIDAGWFGKRAVSANTGTDAFDGHAISDSAQGATAYAEIDLTQFGRGMFNMPMFDAQPARYLRFTALKRREINGAPVATRVRELRVYAESPQQVEQSMVRTFMLDDSMSFLKLKAHIRNNDTITRHVEISGTIKPNNVRFRFYANLEPGETRYIERAGIPIKKPRLWWPNGYGEQFLYTCDVSVKVVNNVSDTRKFAFGIRKFTYTADGGQLTLYCNGTRIVCKGGNWGMDDGLKRDTPQSYDDKVRLHKEANMTMIRNWVGMTQNEAFYDACDKYGILIWDDFWLANPVDGPEPNDTAMFLSNAEDKIKRNRYHTSLALYCGRNEGNPNPEIDAGLRELVEKYDENRLYFPNSAMNPVGSGGGYSLAMPGGERGIKQYFNDVTSPVLRSERGIPNVPAEESLRKFIAPENIWKISEVWALHDWTYHMNGPANSYMYALQAYLGGDFTIPEDRVQGQKPDADDPVFAQYKQDVYAMINDAAEAWTLTDFNRAAQMINYDNHRGLFDALAVRRSNGLLMWMSQSSWPSLMWQTYDWYLDTNGGYFGVKAGNQPTRAVFDPRDNGIVLANATPFVYKNVKTKVEVFDMNGISVAANEYVTETLDADAYGIAVANADFSASPTDVAFLRLTLTDSDGAVLGENTYWHNRAQYMDYRALNGLPRTTVTVSGSWTETLENGNVRHTLHVVNTGAVPSVQTRIRLTGEDGGDVLPVFYSDNYFTLMPGEVRTVTAEYSPAKCAGSAVWTAGGWNV